MKSENGSNQKMQGTSFEAKGCNLTDTETAIVRHFAEGGVSNANEVAGDVSHVTRRERGKKRQRFSNEIYRHFDEVSSRVHDSPSIPAVRAYEILKKMCQEDGVRCPSLRTIQFWIYESRELKRRTEELRSER